MKLAPLLALTLCALSCIPRDSTAETGSVKLGVITSLTGSASAWGKNTQRGMQMAVDQVNGSGGVRGQKIEILFEDFGDVDLKRAASAAQRFLQIDRVDAILTQWTEDTEVAWPVASRSNTLVMTYAAGAHQITKGRNNLFRVWPSDDGLIRRVLRFAESKGVKDLCVVKEQSSYFENMSNVANAEWTAIRSEKPVTSEHSQSDVDFRTTATKFRNCGAVLVLVGRTMFPGVVKQLRSAGSKALFLTYPVATDKGVRDASGAAGDGIVYASYPISTPEFATEFQKRFGEEPGLPAASAHDAVLALARAMETNGLGADNISAGLHKIRDLDGASGLINFTEDGDRAPIEPSLWRIEGNETNRIEN